MKKRSISKIIAVVLASVMIISLTGCIRIEINLGKKTTSTEPSGESYGTEETSDPRETGHLLPNPNVSDVTTAETDSPSAGGSSGGDFSNKRPVYEPIDTSHITSLSNELTALAAGTDSESVISKYNEIYEEYARIYDIDNAAYLDFCDNVSDELSDRYEEANKQLNEAFDTAMTAALAVTQGPCAEVFKAYVGDVIFELHSSYEPMTEEDFARSERITALTTSYYDAMDKDMDEEELNEVVGPIYLELVKLRTEEAQAYGYDNYADYADEQIYMRDYDGEAAAKFHDAVKTLGSRYYAALYGFYWGDYYSLGEDITDMDEIVDALRKYSNQIDPIVSESLDYLENNKLYDVTGGSNRRQGAYTIEFSDGTPYIYATLGSSGFSTINHEFGHFTAAYVNPNPNILVYGNGSLDICEIHSNGLEGLYTHFYEDIYDKDTAPLWENSLILELLGNVVDGCIFDEFQRAVYHDPDMTLDEINKLYVDICKSYGDPYAESYGYWWQQVHHNFESPMYYFSYAASGFVALQIWAVSQDNYESACRIWKEVIDSGAYDYGYMELLNNMGIQDFTDSKTVNEVIGTALDKIEENSSSQSSSSPWPNLFNMFPGGLSDDGRGEDENADIESYLEDLLNNLSDQIENSAGGR